jgi:hypothetical protein
MGDADEVDPETSCSNAARSERRVTLPVLRPELHPAAATHWVTHGIATAIV